MMVPVILVRHGNTFKSGDKIVWVGARTDTPLAPSGLIQAELVAAALRRLGSSFTKILTGPLRRTYDFATRLLTTLPGQISLEIDERLTEIDYGLWEGLSNDEVLERFGPEPLKLWDTHGIQPEGMQWYPEPAVLQQQLQSLLADLFRLATAQETPIICTSHGILRTIYNHCATTAATARVSSKVATGRMCKILLSDSERRQKPHISWWNRSPSEL
jgi:probable phosphoglycerate mutase